MKLFYYLIRFDPAIVYLPISQGIWGFLRDACFIILSKLFNKQIIIHLRGGMFKYFYENSSFTLRFFIKWIMSNVSKGIVQGNCLKFHLEPFLLNNKIYVLPNGLNPDLFKKRRIKSNEKNIKILFLSNLYKTKGYIDVLNAIPGAIEKFNDIHFIFAGEWRSDNSKDEALQIVNKYHLNKYVSFLGPIIGEKKIKLLEESDIFVFPTYYPPEGHPWVLLEAMASGLPIITTDHASIKETVVENENAFFVNKRDSNQICHKLIQLIENKDLRIQMGKKSREHFLKFYTDDHFITGLSNILLD